MEHPVTICHWSITSVEVHTFPLQFIRLRSEQKILCVKKQEINILIDRMFISMLQTVPVKNCSLKATSQPL